MYSRDYGNMVKQLSPNKINKIGLVEKRKDEKLEVQCVVEFSPRTYNYYVTGPWYVPNTT